MAVAAAGATARVWGRGLQRRAWGPVECGRRWTRGHEIWVCFAVWFGCSRALSRACRPYPYGLEIFRLYFRFRPG
jgi:hypothetical protein